MAEPPRIHRAQTIRTERGWAINCPAHAHSGEIHRTKRAALAEYVARHRQGGQSRRNGRWEATAA